MQLTTLIAAAGLAVSTTNAFLLPFSDSSDNDKVTTLPIPINTDFAAPTTADGQKLELACPGCPLRVGKNKHNGEPKIKTNIASHLELDFSIDHAYDHDRLMVNDFELYPNADLLRQPLGAKLLADTKRGRKSLPSHRKHHQPTIHPLGFGLRTTSLAKNDEENMELIRMDLQIIEVDNVFVDGVHSVQINVIKTDEGGLLIAGIETSAEPMSKAPMDKQEECKTLLCKWRAIVMQQLGRFRPNKNCGGKSRHGVGKAEGAHGRPGHHGMHHSHHDGHGKQHRHQFSRLLKNIASHILLPIAVGVVAGVAASILGMLVGTVIVCLWRTFIRPAGSRRLRHRRGFCHRRGSSGHKAVHNEAAATEEKAGLISSQDEEDVGAPPAYVEEGLVENTKPTNES